MKGDLALSVRTVSGGGGPEKDPFGDGRKCKQPIFIYDKAIKDLFAGVCGEGSGVLKAGSLGFGS